MTKLMTTTAMIGALALNSLNAQAAIKKEVSFQSQGQTLSADLYLPDSYQEGDQLAAIVVTGSWTSVKEQMAGGYAEEMADRGYAALAFDFRGWGQSVQGTEGALTFTENPAEKTLDIIAAAEFLANRPEVDSIKVGALGICASAGYATDAALQSNTIKAAAVVAPWYHDAEIVDEVYGDFVEPLMSASQTAEVQYEQTAELTLVPAASIDDETAVMQGEGYYTDPNRGAIPAYDNQFNVMSWEPWLTYDAIKTAEKLQKPTLLVHSEAAAIPQGARKYLEKAGDNAQGVWLENVTQFDFYDNEAAMSDASDEVARHFDNNL